MPAGKIQTVITGQFLSNVRSGLDQVKISLRVQFYYAIGMAVQKGLPFLIIPLLVEVYGAHTYASYVYFFTTVQIFAVFCSLAIPSSTIVFWYREENKTRVFKTYLLVLCAVFVTAGVLCTAPIYVLYRQSVIVTLPLEMTILTLAFIGLYILNQYLVSIYRALESSKDFLAAQIIGGLVLLIGSLAPGLPATVTQLIFAFLLSMLAQDVYLFIGLRKFIRSGRPNEFDWRLCKRVLQFSLPLVIYNAIVLFAFWIDKYMVSNFFEPVQFSRFVVTFQYAFAQSFFGQLFALYNFPLICRLTSEGQDSRLRGVVTTYGSLLVILGLFYSAAVLTCDRYLHALNIDPIGFVLLSVAFMLSNYSTNYLNILYARHRTRIITAIQASCVGFMFIVLIFGCVLRRIELCYGSHIAVYGTALCLLVWAKEQRSKCDPRPIYVDG